MLSLANRIPDANLLRLPPSSRKLGSVHDFPTPEGKFLPFMAHITKNCSRMSDKTWKWTEMAVPSDLRLGKFEADQH